MAQMIICLRYDDWGMHPEALAYDRALVEMADTYDCPITLSVVPQSRHLAEHKDTLLDSHFYTAVENGTLELAMHGCKHSRGILEKLLRVRGEFGKKPLCLQRRQLKAALGTWESIVGVPVHIFVPPYNVYDHNTSTALVELGFDLVSDGPSANRMFGVDAAGDTIRRLPFTCGIERVADLVEALSDDATDTRYYLIALFHHYNYDIRKVEELMSSLSPRENVRFATLQEMRTAIDDDAITALEQQGTAYYRL